MALLGLVIGLCSSAAVTASYDRKGLSRTVDRARDSAA
jgi:hypothetical protein